MIAAGHDAEGGGQPALALPKLVATFVTLISIDNHTTPRSAGFACVIVGCVCVRVWASVGASSAAIVVSINIIFPVVYPRPGKRCRFCFGTVVGSV